MLYHGETARGEAGEGSMKGEQMRFTSKVAAAAMGALMVFTMGAFAGCADNSEQVIRETLVEEFDGYKNLDEATMAEFDSALGSSGLEELGITNEQLAKSILSGFDYTVDSVTVNGNKAEAVVTVTSKNFSDLEGKVTEVVTEITSDPAAVANMSTDELTKLYGQKIMEAMDQMEVTTSDPITIEYELKGNTWEPTEESTDLFSDVFLS